MTPPSNPAPISPVVRWLAIALLLGTVVLLTLGGLTTSKRAGMDDPVWPTEPWYLVVNGQVWQEKQAGFLLEHTHRFAGWAVGGLAAAVAFAAWLSGPNKKARIPAVVAVFLLLGVYGWFHGQMMAAERERQTTGSFTWPWAAIYSTAGMAIVVFGLAVGQLFTRDRAKWVRAGSTLILLGVMVQGLLGGLRVFLNSQIGWKSTIGVEFSQVHGLFAQVVFSGMAILVAMTTVRRAERELPAADRSRLGWLSVALVTSVFVQLIWAVWVRHAPTPLTQRLHILTAFLVAGLIVWLAVRVNNSPGSRRVLGFAAAHLIAMLVVQIAFGVEAWMGKFAATGPEATTPPMDRAVTTMSVLIRTGHQLIGASLLASSAVVAFRVLRSPAAPSEETEREESAHTKPAVGEPVAV